MTEPQSANAEPARKCTDKMHSRGNVAVRVERCIAESLAFAARRRKVGQRIEVSPSSRFGEG